MIVACTKPSEDPAQKTNPHSLNQSSEKDKIQRCNSVPLLSRTAITLEADMLIDDLNKLNDIPHENISLALMDELQKEEKVPRGKATLQSSLIKLQKAEVDEDNLSEQKFKSNASNTPMRCNYLLKSDVCRSSTSNFYYSHQEESPMLNYYAGPNLKKRPSANNDYMLFVKKPKRDAEIDFNTANYFGKNANKKEIMISRYTEDDELVEYINSPSIVPEEEEAVTVEIPRNLKLNKGNSYNNSGGLSETGLLFKQIPTAVSEKALSPQLQQEFIPQAKPIPMQEDIIPQQHVSYQQPQALSQQQQFIQPQNVLKQQQQQSERALKVEQINQPTKNTRMMDPNMLNNYMYVNFMTNQNMIFQMAGGNNGMPQYYPIPLNNYPFQSYPNPYQMMNNNSMAMNPQMQPPNPLPSLQPQKYPPNSSNAQFNPNMKLNYPMNLSMNSMNNKNGPIISNNLTKRQQKQPSNNYTNYSDESLAQLAPFLIKEQSGCRYIQDKVNADPHFANDILFHHLKEEIIDLICDPFGNYLFQVLIDVLTQENLEVFFHLITPSFYQICISPHGTRVVQKIIDKIPSNLALLKLFNHMISFQLLDTCKDPYGNHIIQKYLSFVRFPHNQFVYECIYSNFLGISNSKHGCCVIQKGISEGSEEQRARIIALINQNLFKIITDQFGNYTLQYIFSNQQGFDIDSIIETVLENIVYLCMQKYSSNVLEKCFENSNKHIQHMLVQELVKNDNVICDLISDSYGNYVIQKALLVTKNENYFKILNVIAANIGRIKKQSFGSKLIAKLLVTHKELGNMVTSYKSNKEYGGITQSNVPSYPITTTYEDSNQYGETDESGGYYVNDNGNGSGNSNYSSMNYNSQGKTAKSYYPSHNSSNYYKKKAKDKSNNGYKR